jgi:SAM-dependent methyltransferase
MINAHSKLIADQYDIISDEFDCSRVRIWNKVNQFLTKHNKIFKKSLLDAGVGNGKNLIFANNLNYHTLGIDISEKLLQICRKKNIEVHNVDVLDLYPHMFGKFDIIISIAVIHHLKTIESQIQAIVNMLNCLVNNGHLLISVWSHETIDIFSEKSEEIECRNFDIGPNIVEWNSKNKQTKIDRFYFIHDFVSFYVMMCQVSEIVPISFAISWEKQNWFCEIHKL